MCSKPAGILFSTNVQPFHSCFGQFHERKSGVYENIEIKGHKKSHS